MHITKFAAHTAQKVVSNGHGLLRSGITALIIGAGLVLPVGVPAHADMLVHKHWSCDVPAYDAEKCGPTIDVDNGGVLYAGVDRGSADGVHFTAYTGLNQQIKLGDCSAEPGTACKIWTNTTGDTVTVAFTVHDNGWHGHHENGGYEVRTD